MILLFGIILILVGTILDASASDWETSERKRTAHYTEMKRQIAENNRTETKRKVIKRKIVKDINGNVIAEEITEEYV